MDRISNLPEPLMEKILFGLPSKDSIRMSFSSKQWQTLWNSRWNSIPVEKLEFKNWSFSSEGKSPDKFVALVDDTLRRNLPAEQKKIVEFELLQAFDTPSRKMEVDSDVVDRWIKMVTRNYVTLLRLYIEITPNVIYRFPPAAFDVGVLVELNLTQCRLEKAFIEEHTLFIRLKTLVFGYVNFNEVAAGELLSRCPLLERLELRFCANIKHLELCDDLPNLKKVELRNYSDIFTYKIDSPCLEYLLYYENRKPMDMEAVSCNKLKKLYVAADGSNISGQYIKRACSKYPLLEDLILNAKSFGSKDVDEIRISGQHLKSLEVRGHISKHMIINLDAPNLVCYQHEDDEIPSTFLLNSVKLEWVKFAMYGEIHINSAWFIKLRKYMGSFTARDCSCFTLYHRWTTVDQFSFEELQEEKLPPLPKVRQLILKWVPPSNDYTSLIDGLLWCCHPLTISVHAYPNRQFIKFLHKMLTDREERPLCCKECHVKCWRHCLSSVKIKSLCESDGEDDHGLEDESNDAKLLKTLRALEKDHVFELQWSALEEDRELDKFEIVFL